MVEVIPSGASLGARIEGLDLSQPLSDADIEGIRAALGAHGVVCFPGQDLDPARQKAFAVRFGSLEVNVAAAGFTPADHPEIMVLSNIVEDGRPIGLADAGQGWHTDMSYSRTIAFLTVLHGIEIPRRGERPLGATEFADMGAAYDDLPADLKRLLEGRTATHDFEKFWDEMRRRPGSARPPLSGAQRRRKPPVSHPVVQMHAISGRKVLYCNPGYVVRIDGILARDSDQLLETLFDHQLSPKYRFRHDWTQGDLLVWDDIRTVHNAIADYTASDRRHMRRCQVMADRILAAPTATRQ